MRFSPRSDLRLRLSHAGWLVVMMLGALAMALSASGCIWLAVPSLAYQGYKYEQKQKSSTSQKHSSDSATNNSSYE